MTRRIAAVCLTALLMTGCTPSQMVLLLDAVVAAADAALTTTNNCPQCVTYLNAVALGAQCATTELGSGDTGPVEYGKIATCFAAAIAPVLPAGPSATAIQAVVVALQAFMNTLKVAADASPMKPIKLTQADRGKLTSIQTHAKQVQVKMGK